MKILAYRMPELVKMVEKFNKKATKWNLPLVELNEIERGFEERKIVTDTDQEGRAVESKITVEYVSIELEGETPRLSGWAIHSKIQPSAIAGQNFVFTTKDFFSYDALRTKPLFCEHCQTKRLKKNAYWIVHEDGRQMMVGATCLQDFLPAVNVDALIGYMNQISAIEDSDEWDDLSDMPRGEYLYRTYDAIEEAYLSIKKWGYTSKRMEEEDPTRQPTAYDIDAAPKKKAELYKDVDIVEVKNELTAFIPHMMAKSDAGNDFLYNVKLALQLEYIRPKMFSYIAAAVNTWIRDNAAAREASAKPSAYVGTKGVTMTFTDLTVTSVTACPGFYGTSYLYIFMDKDGNKYKWFASSEQNVKPGDNIKLRAKIKDHEEFRGSKQTVLTRGSVL